MQEIKAHQLLHGYRSGHGQLGGSIKLASRDSELVTRLSDLSGSLSSGLQIEPYLTCYPLPSGEFHAIARTWPDHEAARAGCVLTHTILIPEQAWSKFKNVRSIDRCFRNPRLHPDYQFTESIDIDDGTDAHISFGDVKVNTEAARAFVSRYFGQGVRPIVWFNAEKPEEYFWRLMEHLWPRLRTAFSCCTFSLLPRQLQDRPFDLLFAPGGVYSRFTKLTPDHLIDAGKIQKLTGTEVEPWCEFWADALFSDRTGLPSGENELPMWNELGEDPGGARKLSLIHELRLRASQSPTAGVGAIDVVESLAREASTAVPLKNMVFNSAIEAASSAADVQEGLTAIRLIEDRLARDAFSEVSHKLHSSVRSAASCLAEREPVTAIQTIEACTSSSPEDNSEFQSGILLGLCEVAQRNPSVVQAMENYPSTAIRLLNLEPALAALYLRGAGPSAPNLVTSWLASTKDVEVLRAVRKAIFPVLLGDESEELVSALLRDLTSSEVPETLDELFRASDGFRGDFVLRLVTDRVSGVYPAEVRRWATKTHARETQAVAELLAATFADTPAGYEDFLSETRFSDAQRAQILAKMLESHARSGMPYWLREMVSKNEAFVEILVSIPQPAPELVDRALYRILDEVEDISLPKTVTEDLKDFEGRPVFPLLVDKVMRARLISYVTGEEEQRHADSTAETETSDRWLRNIPSGKLSALLLRGRAAGPDGVGKVWSWIAGAGRVVYQRQDALLSDVLDALLPSTRQSFNPGIESTLVSVLKRAKSESASEVRQAVTAKFLRFALDNTRLALGEVVAESFADVYAVVAKDDHRQPSFFSFLFVSYDWDKGKDLRVALVDSFVKSDWRPGHLALAAERAGILGKIFKRLRRRPRGDEYILAMEKDLRLWKTPESARTRERLTSMMADPDFYEEWD